MHKNPESMKILIFKNKLSYDNTNMVKRPPSGNYCVAMITMMRRRGKKRK